jgi:hypothetical protein
MKMDLYTKITLTIIALLLMGNLLKSVLTPSVVQAREDAKFSLLQYSMSTAGVVVFFDTKTGNMWFYHDEKPNSILKLNELGKPLQFIELPK